MLFIVSALLARSVRAAVFPVTADMRDASSAIIQRLLPASGVTQLSSTAWQRLAYMTDTFGPRFSGSAGLERALNWVRDTARAVDGLRVTEMVTMVPRWVRGNESAWLTAPRLKKLHFVGLGMSVGTNGSDLNAPVFVISGASPADAYQSLQGNCSAIQSLAEKPIVLFNVPFTTYGGTVPVRASCGEWAAACGAVGALIRSVGPFSLQNPHTGATTPSIPSGAVSLEDAAQLQRMFDRGQAIRVTLNMQAQQLPDSQSRNLLIDLVGSGAPEEFVVVSGHADSWDIAEGAMDDGGGAVGAWEAVRTVAALGLKPKRTLRAVLWVNEENGDRGGAQYAADFGPNGTNALARHSFMLETDSGAFTPFGIGVSCAAGADCGAAQAQLALIGAALLGGIGSGNVSAGGGGTDVDPSCAASGVPCIGLNVLDPRLSADSNNPCIADAMGAWASPPWAWSAAAPPYDSQYFWVHHSEGSWAQKARARARARASRPKKTRAC
jgi:carboxypeptidase Q